MQVLALHPVDETMSNDPQSCVVHSISRHDLATRCQYSIIEARPSAITPCTFEYSIRSP